MDLDVLEKNGRAVLAFKGELETLLPQLHKAITDVVVVSGDIDEVRAILTPALSKIEAMKPDIEAVISDIAEIKETLGPALAWIAEQQKAIDAAKAAPPAEKPAETHPADPTKPLEHIAEVEAGMTHTDVTAGMASTGTAVNPSPRSESETTTG